MDQIIKSPQFCFTAKRSLDVVITLVGDSSRILSFCQEQTLHMITNYTQFTDCYSRADAKAHDGRHVLEAHHHLQVEKEEAPCAHSSGYKHIRLKGNCTASVMFSQMCFYPGGGATSAVATKDVEKYVKAGK